MKKNYFSHLSEQYLFSLFYSSKKSKTNQFKKHHHTEVELGLVLKGEGEYVLNGKTLPAREGDLFVVRSNEPHCIPTIKSPALVAFNIQLSPYYLWSVCSDYIPASKIRAMINGDIPINHKLSDSKIILSFKKIASLFESDDENSLFEIRSEVLRSVKLIASLIDADEKEKLPSAGNLENIQKAIDFIKENYGRHILIDDIARSAAMSRTYFSNTFKSVTGISPYNYLMTTRIERATELLKDRKKAVMSIALECGFTSLSSFNKAFKQLVGATPTEVRTQMNIF